MKLITLLFSLLFAISSPSFADNGFDSLSEADWDRIKKAAFEKGYNNAQPPAQKSSDLEDKDWWERNRKSALTKRKEYSECVLKHVGNAATNQAVGAVKSSCKELYWPHEWPSKYLTSTPM